MGDGLGATRKIGDRVGAVQSAKGGVVKLFGFGVYEGDFVPTEAVGFIADAAREAGITNPRIKLDSGKVVYGCECWWGSEAAVQKRFAGQKIVEVDIDAVRIKYKVAQEAAAAAAKAAAEAESDE
jgi:hypothetical protein